MEKPIEVVARLITIEAGEHYRRGIFDSIPSSVLNTRL